MVTVTSQRPTKPAALPDDFSTTLKLEDVATGDLPVGSAETGALTSEPLNPVPQENRADAVHKRSGLSADLPSKDQKYCHRVGRTDDSPSGLSAPQPLISPPLIMPAVGPALARHSWFEAAPAQNVKSFDGAELGSEAKGVLMTDAEAAPIQVANSADPLARQSEDGSDQIESEPAAFAPRAQSKGKAHGETSLKTDSSANGFPIAPRENADGLSLKASPAIQTDVFPITPSASPPRDGGSQGVQPSSAAAPDAGHDGGHSLPPVEQLGQALATLHSGPNGSSHTVIQLDPGDLGSVQIRITRAHDGAASVSVAVEKPETLRTLQADLSSLHHALDRAGLPEHRSLEVHLSPNEVSMGSHQSPAQGGQGGEPRYSGARQDKGLVSAKTDLPSNEQIVDGLKKLLPSHWLRAGVNITA